MNMKRPERDPEGRTQVLTRPTFHTTDARLAEATRRFCDTFEAKSIKDPLPGKEVTV